MTDALPALLTASRRRFESKVALSCSDGEFTFAEVDDYSSAFAGALRERDVAPGDRVVLYAPNCWEWVFAYFGALKAGAVVVPVNYALTADELGYIVRNCEPRLILIHADRAEYAERLIDYAGGARIVTVGRTKASVGEEFSEFIKATPAQTVKREPLDPAMICYTSGTTGRPKGAVLSQQSVSLNANLTALMHGRSSNDVVVSALPLPHVYGHVVMNSTLRSGGTLVLKGAFDAGDALASIESHRATMFEGVPAMYLYMLSEPSLNRRNYDSLRICTVGGQTMPVDKMSAIESAFGCPLIELWGMTELAGLGTTHPHTGPVQLGSIGVALPFLETKISEVDEHGSDQVGELLVRGPQVMLGYYRNEEATANSISADGWLRTGDIARKDQFNRIYVVDRKKDMILCGGYNVYPAEIERVISEHPAVAMVAVCGRAHATKGEAPEAFVVTKPGVTVDLSTLDSFCRERLAAYKAPRKFHLVSELPKTSTGKILRRALREIDPQTLN
jgi:long-chain acyl-CoA synthetase